MRKYLLFGFVFLLVFTTVKADLIRQSQNYTSSTSINDANDRGYIIKSDFDTVLYNASLYDSSNAPYIILYNASNEVTRTQLTNCTNSVTAPRGCQLNYPIYKDVKYMIVPSNAGGNHLQYYQGSVTSFVNDSYIDWILSGFWSSGGGGWTNSTGFAWGIQVIFINNTVPSSILEFDEITFINNTIIKNNLSENIFYNFTYFAITNNSIDCYLLKNNLSIEKNTVLINETSEFSLNFGAFYGTINYAINCSNNEKTVYSGIYNYELDTYSLLTFENTKKIWGEIQMLAIGLLFVVIFLWLSFKMNTPAMMSFGGLGFMIIAVYYGTLFIDDGELYQIAITYASIFIGFGIVVTGLIGQIIQNMNTKENFYSRIDKKYKKY